MSLIRTKATALDSQGLLELIEAQAGASNGISVTPLRSLKVPEVTACINVLAQSMAMLPFSVYEKKGEIRTKITDNPVYKVLAQKPNDYQSPYEFVRQMMFNAAWVGNAYARKVVLGGKLIALVPLEPSAVKVKLLNDGSIQYEYTTKVDGRKQVEKFTTKEIFHLRGPISPKGYVSESPITMARDTIATMMAIESFGSKFFTGSAKAKGAFILPPDGELDDEAYERLKASLDSANGDKALLLEQGLQFMKMDYSARESQLSELTNIMVHKLCRVWRIQPHMIQSLDKATFSNIEHQGREFVDHTLMPWIRLWESAIKMQLMDVANDSVYPKFSAQALLRGDNKTRNEVYAKAVGGPYMTPNQARALEDMEPIEGGDELYLPSNYSNKFEDKPEVDSQENNNVAT